MLGNTAVINFSQPRGKGVSVYKGRGHGRELSEDCWPDLLHVVLKCGGLRVVRLTWHLPDRVPLEQVAQGNRVEAAWSWKFHSVTSGIVC